ncbi:hypothetical protein ABZ135_20100 [Streptomyces sp. NPDC006339]|uniref:hypothetical protein n=1 Tax=Streptomyces sp. NPDC006339 TaxID=3156755 RepID=UPI0033A4487B
MSAWASWTLVIGGVALLLAPSIAVLLGWRPNRLARPGAPARLLGGAGVMLYGAVLTNEAARLAEASSAAREACSLVALGLVGFSIAFVIIYDFRAVRPSRSGRR